MNEQSRIVRHPNALSAPLLQESILIDPDAKEYFCLEDVGHFIWGQIETEKSLGEIATNISNSFKVDYEIALADLIEFAESLLEKKLVIVSA